MHTTVQWLACGYAWVVGGVYLPFLEVTAQALQLSLGQSVLRVLFLARILSFEARSFRFLVLSGHGGGSLPASGASLRRREARCSPRSRAQQAAARAGAD